LRAASAEPVSYCTAAHSPGGLGKTALARQYCHAFAEFYAAGGTWEIPCEGVATLGAALLKLADEPRFLSMGAELGLPLVLSPAQRENFSLAAAGVLDYLRIVTQRRVGVLREELKAAIDADAESYNVVMKAYKAAKESADGAPAISAALQQATAVPLGVAEKAVEVEQIVTQLRPITSPNMKSDLITAAALAKAALAGALANVDINLSSLSPDSPEDAAFATQTRKRVVALTEQA